MTQATTTNTNIPRRAHPAVVRAALRSQIAANRRTQENHYPNAAALAAQNAVKSVSYSYNILDRLTGYADGNTIATYTFDAKQLRQTGESVNYASTGSAPTGFSLSTSTTYNALGQKSSLTYPDGNPYSYTYDTNNQLSTVNLPAGFGSITFNSYTWTVPAQITLPGGTVRNQQYDGLLRLKTLAVKDPGQSQVMNYQYGYDLTNNIVAKATEAGTTSRSPSPPHLTPQGAFLLPETGGRYSSRAERTVRPPYWNTGIRPNPLRARHQRASRPTDI
jgi:YD repeat-containing protein